MMRMFLRCEARGALVGIGVAVTWAIGERLLLGHLTMDPVDIFFIADCGAVWAFLYGALYG